MKTLPIEPLSAGAFAGFGQVIETATSRKVYSINAGNTLRFHDIINIETLGSGRPIVSIFCGQPRSLPFEITMLERHPLGSQAFMPLDALPYLVAVAPHGESPTIESVKVFYCRGDQGVNYAAGIWHHPLLALESPSNFLVIDRDGEGNNCEEFKLLHSGIIQALRCHE